MKLIAEMMRNQSQGMGGRVGPSWRVGGLTLSDGRVGGFYGWRVVAEVF
jgi:hypothetical protein